MLANALSQHKCVAIGVNCLALIKYGRLNHYLCVLSKHLPLPAGVPGAIAPAQAVPIASAGPPAMAPGRAAALPASPGAATAATAGLGAHSVAGHQSAGACA